LTLTSSSLANKKPKSSTSPIQCQSKEQYNYENNNFLKSPKTPLKKRRCSFKTENKLKYQRKITPPITKTTLDAKMQNISLFHGENPITFLFYFNTLHCFQKYRHRYTKWKIYSTHRQFYTKGTQAGILTGEIKGIIKT